MKLSNRIIILFILFSFSYLCSGMEKSTVHHFSNNPLYLHLMNDDKKLDIWYFRQLLGDFQIRKNDTIICMTQAFSASLECVKKFEKGLGELPQLWLETNSNLASFIQQTQESIEHAYLDILGNMPYITSRLDHETLDCLSVRYLKNYVSMENARKKDYLKRALEYSVYLAKFNYGVGAKQGNDIFYVRSYERILSIIEGKIQNGITQYELYYDCLIPLLQSYGEGAQNLFNEVCFQSTGALDHVEKYINLSEKLMGKIPVNKERLETLKRAKSDFDSWLKYKESIRLLGQNPSEAIKLLFESFDSGCSEAKHKAATLRATEGYKNPKYAKKYDHGALLKMLEEEKALGNYRNYQMYRQYLAEASKSEQYSESDLNKIVGEACVYLSIAVKFGNPDAINEAWKLKQTNGYKKAQGEKVISNQNDLFDRLAQCYYPMQRLFGEALPVEDVRSSHIDSKDVMPFESNASLTTTSSTTTSQPVSTTDNKTLFFNSHPYWKEHQDLPINVHLKGISQNLRSAVHNLITVVHKSQKLGSDVGYRNDLMSFLTDNLSPLMSNLTEALYLDSLNEVGCLWASSLNIIVETYTDLEQLFEQEIGARFCADFSQVTNPFLRAIFYPVNTMIGFEKYLEPMTRYKIGKMYQSYFQPKEEEKSRYKDLLIPYFIHSVHQGNEKAKVDLVDAVITLTLPEAFIDTVWAMSRRGQEVALSQKEFLNILQIVRNGMREKGGSAKIIDYFGEFLGGDFSDTHSVSTAKTVNPIEQLVQENNKEDNNRSEKAIKTKTARTLPLIRKDSVRLQKQSGAELRDDSSILGETSNLLKPDSVLRNEPTTQVNTNSAIVTSDQLREAKANVGKKNHLRRDYETRDSHAQEGKVQDPRLFKRHSMIILPSQSENMSKPQVRRTNSSSNLKSLFNDEKVIKEKLSKEEKAEEKKKAREKKPSKDKSGLKLKNFFSMKKSKEKKEKENLERSQSQRNITNDNIDAEELNMTKSSESPKSTKSSSSKSSESIEYPDSGLKKLTRKLSNADLRNIADVVLTENIIYETLNSLQDRELITWSLQDNVLSATMTTSAKRCGTHTHDKPGRKWYESKAFTKEFLSFVSSCDPELAAQISSIGKKEQK